MWYELQNDLDEGLITKTEFQQALNFDGIGKCIVCKETFRNEPMEDSMYCSEECEDWDVKNG